MVAAALLREAKDALESAGIASAARDAERLLRHVLGWDRATLVARPGAEVGPAQAERFRALVGRRAGRVPLQHLTGKQAFWRHDFLVTPAVLVPRPETELLVETALALLGEATAVVAVDVGTGSGCIALSLAAELPAARVYATDLSPEALDVARANTRRLGLEERVAFHQGDLLAPVASLAGRVDLVVCNPPYVDPEERDGLAPEVREHEPAIALFAREPFPGIYQRLARQASASLRPGGFLVAEIGLGQEPAVTAVVERAGLALLEVRQDLAGIPRAVVAARPR